MPRVMCRETTSLNQWFYAQEDLRMKRLENCDVINLIHQIKWCKTAIVGKTVSSLKLHVILNWGKC